MKYVALLRGINVGGNNKVEMKRLREVFEGAGMENVSTYINSGNVIFESVQAAEKLPDVLEKAIENEFGFHVKVLVKSKKVIDDIAKALPDSWVNDRKTMKCDVMFLWEKYDDIGVLDKLTIKPGIDNILYVDGALLWSVDVKHIGKSGMMRLAGTDLYAHMTIRNCNTLRKLHALMNA